jgi:hypothetical protein
MKDLSNVEVKQGDIVYFFEQESGDLEFGEVLQVSEKSAYISQLRLVEDEDGKQELHRLIYDAAVTSSPMIFVLPGASQRIPIREPEIVIESMFPKVPSRAIEMAITNSILA